MVAEEEGPIVAIRPSSLRLVRPRQWGACWLGCELRRQLGLDTFWQHKLPSGWQGARWDKILQVLTLYRLIAPGSEGRLHRHWFEQSALAYLPGEDFGLAEIHRLSQCHDKLLEHKKALFDHLTERWRTLSAAKDEVLLYDSQAPESKLAMRSGALAELMEEQDWCGGGARCFEGLR